MTERFAVAAVAGIPTQLALMLLPPELLMPPTVVGAGRW